MNRWTVQLPAVAVPGLVVVFGLVGCGGLASGGGDLAVVVNTSGANLGATGCESIRVKSPAGDVTAMWPRFVIDSVGGFGADGTDLADHDGDGDLDVVTAWEEQGRVRIALNPGPERVEQPWPTIQVCDTCGHIEDSHFVDLDSDGRIDVVTSSQHGREIFVSWNEGGSWRTERIPAASGVAEWASASHGRLDGRDGIDLVVSPAPGVALLHAPTNARDLAGWTLEQLTPEATAPVEPLFVRDMDGDGDLDILYADRNTRTAWLENGEDGWEEHVIGHAPITRLIAEHDMDGDGDPDVLAASDDRGSPVSWYQRPADPASSWRKHVIMLDAPFPASHARSVSAGDLDLDGRIDVVVMGQQPVHHAYWMSYQDSVYDETWDGHLIFDESPAKFDEVQLLDLDCDGDLDVLSSDEFTGVVWFRNPTR